MTYLAHIRDLIAAFRAATGWSNSRLSTAAGLGVNWVSQCLALDRGTLSNADAVVAVIRAHCPAGPEGDDLRDLLARLDPAPENEGAAA